MGGEIVVRGWCDHPRTEAHWRRCALLARTGGVTRMAGPGGRGPRARGPGRPGTFDFHLCI